MMTQTSQYRSIQTDTKALKKILVVDDEPDINTIAKIALESFGKFHVETCSSGIEAIKKAEWFEPNLILLDVMMPFMDGEETLGRLKRNPKTSGIPVIFVTAKIFNHDSSKYKQLGALDVIPKPFDPVGLSNRVREIWTDFQVRDTAEREITEKIADMRRDFIGGLPERLEDLREKWLAYLDHESMAALKSVYEAIHKITGVSGTVRHMPVYEASARMEGMLLGYLENAEYRLSNDDKGTAFGIFSELARESASKQHVA